MTKPDIEVTYGIDRTRMDADFKEMERRASRAHWQIQRDFERYEKAQERAAREKFRKLEDGYRKTERVSQVAFVAAAAGVAVFTKALQKAAERNGQLASQLESIGRSRDSLFADLGDDLSPFISGLGTAIDRVNELRKGVVNAVAEVMAFGQYQNIRDVDTERQRAIDQDQRFNSATAAQDLERELAIARGGSEAEEAQAMQQRRAFLKKVAGVGDPLKRDELIAQYDRDAKAKRDQKASEQREAERNNRRSSAIRIDEAEAAALTSLSDYDPGDLDKFIAASVAREEAAIARLRQEIDGRAGVSDEDRGREFTARARAIHNAAIAERQEREKILEAQQRAAEVATKQLALEREQSRIEILRARGKDELADKAQAELDFARDRLAIEQRRELTEQQRAELIEQRATLRDARLGGTRSQSDEPAAVGIGPGLMGGATLIRQLVGNGSGLNGRDPVEENTAKQVELTQELIDVVKDTDGSGVARAG